MSLESLRRARDEHKEWAGFVKRLTVLALIIGLALFLSTLGTSDGSRERSFDGDFFIGLIPWAVVIFAGAEGVRWLRRELRLAKRRHEDRRR